MSHEDEGALPVGTCGGWWRHGVAATGAPIMHECERPAGHAGPCVCSCGTSSSTRGAVAYREGTP